MIQLFLTGGTIDKHYIESNGTMAFEHTHIEQLLAQGRNRTEIAITQLMLKDSLEMDNDDRELIADSCQQSDANKILITHGTDTMTATAHFMAQKYPELQTNKTIVFAGAMIPYEIRYSDAEFNLGFALGALSALNKGIYIAMNGKIFNYDQVSKNLELGEFQQL